MIVRKTPRAKAKQQKRIARELRSNSGEKELKNSARKERKGKTRWEEE